jgi:peptidyl-prolyl cis-trans isomerase B (cyclophilin B)
MKYVIRKKKERGKRVKKNLIRKPLGLIIVVLLILAFAATWTYAKTASKTVAKPAKKVVVKHPKVEIQMANGKIMIFELYPEYAPATVANFLSLAKSGFYNGLKFHRIIAGFMAQGGDPLGTGMGGSSKPIKGEFANNGFKQNTLKHTKGVISMARTGDPNSASSQFFIMAAATPGLDGDYAAFGKLIEGEKTLDEIMKTPVKLDPNNQDSAVPLKPVIIKKVIVLDDGK